VKKLMLTEADRRIIWVGFANSDRSRAKTDLLRKDIRVHGALKINDKLDAAKEGADKNPVAYQLEDGDYEHLKTTMKETVGWARVPEAIAQVLHAEDAIAAAVDVPVTLPEEGEKADAEKGTG
jgi:hypothetical protein